MRQSSPGLLLTQSMFTLLLVTMIYGVVICLMCLPASTANLQQISYRFDSPTLSSAVLLQATQEAQARVLIGKYSRLTVFTDNEVAHLQDVHQVVMKVLMICVLAVIGVSVFLFKLGTKIWNNYLIGGASILIILCTVILAGIFPWFFEHFHQLFFPAGNYAFPANSVLIQTFPPSFWLLEFLGLQSGVVLSLGLVMLVCQAGHAKPSKF